MRTIFRRIKRAIDYPISPRFYHEKINKNSFAWFFGGKQPLYDSYLSFNIPLLS
ncbi:hypothetical protein PROVRETT_06295 [Providencia rettgeri DSM 1131]|nr:hypothetical protein PROVRETT_06295 [Providencia rettgeri DSM 1131]